MIDTQPPLPSERNAARDQAILSASRSILLAQGLPGFTRGAVAQAAGVSAGSVSNFGRSQISNGTHDDTGYQARILDVLMADAFEQDDRAMLMIGVATGRLTVGTDGAINWRG